MGDFLVALGDHYAGLNVASTVHCGCVGLMKINPESSSTNMTSPNDEEFWSCKRAM
jgi:hypothetical protein